MNILHLKSPAKVNLFLKILGRRPDGYHELASLMQTISLCDTLTFTLSDHDRFTCTDPSLPHDSSNLVIAALDLFRRRSGDLFSIHLHLEKQIPIQAGLGGGSSNAATTLWGLNHLRGHRFSDRELMEMGAELGSDVPFFLSQGTAYCEGRGERVTELPPMPAEDVWIVKPREGLSTPQVYRTLELSKLSPRDPHVSLKKIALGSPEYYNDLEDPALTLEPRLGLIKSDLERSGYSTVLLSGSGTSFFCLGEGGIPLTVEGISTFKSRFINRTAERWYE